MMFKRASLALKLESDRMIYLDLLRIASCFLIILYHFQNQMDLGSATEAVRLRLEGLTLMVDLFFFISGFVIHSVYIGRINSRGDFGNFMGKRVARIVPLHWATFAIFAGFGVAHAMGYLPSNHPEIYDPRCAVPNLLLLHAFGPCSSLTFNYVSWSISAEMGMYILYPLLAILAGRRYLAPVVVAGIVALLSIMTARADVFWLEWSFDGGVLRALPSFLLGATGFTHRATLARIPRARLWLTAAFLLYVVGCLLQWPKLPMLLLIYGTAMLGIAASEQGASRLARGIAPIGQLTYSLYMLHPLVQAVLLTGVGATFLRLEGWTMTLFAFGGIALMVPISWVSLVVFERPTRRWVTRLMQKRPLHAEPALFTPDSRW